MDLLNNPKDRSYWSISPVAPLFVSGDLLCLSFHELSSAQEGTILIRALLILVLIASRILEFEKNTHNNGYIGYIIWLVVSSPLKNIRHLGWWHSQYVEKKNISHQPVIRLAPKIQPSFLARFPSRVAFRLLHCLRNNQRQPESLGLFWLTVNFLWVNITCLLLLLESA